MFAKVKQLFTNLVIYGLGDVATTIISFFLLPIYVRYLSPDDYGVLSLLLTTEVVTKILFRWGIDASFMRLYHDCADQRARQVLASTRSGSCSSPTARCSRSDSSARLSSAIICSTPASTR